MLTFVKDEITSLNAKIDKKFDKVESRVAYLESMVVQSNSEAAKMKLESIEEDDRPNLQQSSVSDTGDMPGEEPTEASSPEHTSVNLSFHEAQDVLRQGEEDASDVAGPTPGPELWGQVGGLAPGPGVDYKGGVLTSDGNPDWDHNKIWKYVGSFKKNILNMHPILIPKELDAMVKVFLEQLPKSSNIPSSRTSNYSAGFIHPPPAVPETGSKRKRSPGNDELSPGMSFRKPGRPYRNVHSALVLVVLALVPR
ncbi:hypothetical protein ONZ43_g7401 [Nemania bipapillata]|uniref:Uncharacterized protein n=1 Tax=Nemania bipapillata TaxID=110536 RepID=A0ACC2HR15_9PEZI|nr:hypothetical protein ONZ43_g7401 [Nemania bipapillata]